MIIGQSGYHEITYNPLALRRTVARVSKRLLALKKKLKFDAIAFRGSSGSAIAYPVSVATGLHLIYVRKERKHHGTPIEASDGKDIKRYVVLDDFISSGETVRAIINKLNKLRGDDRGAPVCVGVALYNNDDGGRIHIRADKKTYKVYSV